MEKCVSCEKAPFYTRRYSGEKLCLQHFKDSVVNKVSKTISKYKMISYGDKVGVAVSGGKDSLSLLLIMSKLCEKKGIELVALTVDEGIHGYRDEAIENAVKISESLGIKHVLVSYKELFGFTLDKALNWEERDISSCSFCGVMRRRAIDEAGIRAGVNVIATAHNLDDFVQTFLMNIMHGDVERLYFMNPNYSSGNFTLKRVKPMIELYEEETALFAYVSGVPFQSVGCPYMHEGLRSEVRDFLNKMELEHPGMKYVLFNSAMHIISNLKYKEKNSVPCINCGKPSSSGLCNVCKMVQTIKDKSSL